MKVKSVLASLAVLTACFMAPSLARAQEGEPVVVDEVIAQVNDGIVTLSQLKREMRERIETMKQNGMTEQQAIAEAEADAAHENALHIIADSSGVTSSTNNCCCKRARNSR